MIKTNIILGLVFILGFINIIQGQDLNRFYNSKKVLPPNNDFLFSQFIYLNDTIYAVNNKIFYSYPLTEVFNTASGLEITNYTSSFITSSASSHTIGGMAINGEFYFALSQTYIIKMKILDDNVNQIFNYQSTYDGIGGFSFGDTVYFPIKSPSDSMVRVDANSDPITTSDIEVDSISSVGSSCVAFDDTLTGTGRYAFIGDENGGVLVYDVSNNQELQYYTNPDFVGSYERYAIAVDHIRKNLYVCTNYNGGGLIVEVLSYLNISTTQQLEYIGKFALMDGIRCSYASMDTVEGQVFFGVELSSQMAIIGTDVAGESQGIGLFSFDSELDVLYMVPQNSINQLTLFTGSEIITMKYHSVCPLDCSGNGFCDYGVCNCTEPYTGPGCSTKKCLNDCNGPEHGTCGDGTCICTSNFTGPDCMELRCPDDCFNHGKCSGSPAYLCTCFEGFNGTNCNNQIEYPPPPCSSFNESSSCVDRIGCGWCHMDSECRDGDRYGPYEGFCRTWYFEQDVETGVIILAAIFIGLISILFLIDIFSTIPIDNDRAKAYSEEFSSGTYPKLSHEDASVLWWRDQRSAKAWSLMDQFQFLSLISHLGVVFPSRFLHFTEYLDWTNLGIPFPPTINPPEVQAVVGRATLSMYQYDNSLGVGPLYQLANILFWFILLCGAFLVPLLLIFIILSIFERYIHWKEVIRNRLIHVSIRILTFGYIGVMISSCYSMVAPIHDYRVIIPGAILFVLYGIGFPLALFLLLKVPETRLHHPTFKQQFGCLYVNFKPKSDHRFFIFGFIKRFVMAVVIGILAFKPAPTYPITGTDLAVPIVQVGVIVLVLIGYIVILAIRKPYFDHFHQWLEYFLSGVNIVTAGLCLTHIKSPSVAGELIAWILQALALVACIAAYMISWLQMKSVVFEKLKKLFKFCSCCKKNDKEIDMNEFKK